MGSFQGAIEDNHFGNLGKHHMRRLWSGLLILVMAIVLLLPQLTQAQQQCDPSYLDVCIAPVSPDLDCADVPYQNFRVLQPDPHRFDRDKDGIECEV